MIGNGSLERKIQSLALSASRISGKEKMTKCNHENAQHVFLDRLNGRLFILCQECHREIEAMTFDIADLDKNLNILRKKYSDFLDKTEVNGIDLGEIKD